jgi:hypothetical protein
VERERERKGEWQLWILQLSSLDGGRVHQSPELV